MLEISRRKRSAVTGLDILLDDAIARQSEAHIRVGRIVDDQTRVISTTQFDFRFDLV